MEKKYKKPYIEDLEKVSGGDIFIEEDEKCPLYGEHKWKQIEGSTMEYCDCGIYRVRIKK